MIPRRRTPIDGSAFVASWFEAQSSGEAAVDRFERAFAAHADRAFAVASCSGRAALLGALRTLGVGMGDEVVLPAYTLGDLPKMLRQAGIVPVFADVDAQTLLVAPEAVARAIGPKTRAVIPTDLFGATARWREVLGGAAPGIPLVEDAAHAAGSTIDGRPVGTHAPLAFFSLETIKVMHSFGGGVVVTDDARIAAEIRARLPSARPRGRLLAKKFVRNAIENFAFRTPAYQAALLAAGEPRVHAALVSIYDRIRYGGVLTAYGYGAWPASFAARQLKTLPARVSRRREIARAIVDGLRDRLEFVREPPGVQTNRYFLVAYARQDPVRLRRALLLAGIDLGTGSEITDFCPSPADAASFPNAWRAHQSLVQLPLFESMRPREIDRLISAVRRATSPG